MNIIINKKIIHRPNNNQQTSYNNTDTVAKDSFNDIKFTTKTIFNIITFINYTNNKF